MRVLVLGAQGMLGQELVRVFGDAEVTAWDRAEIDITDAPHAREAIVELRPDIIVNAVAWNAVDAMESEPDRANVVNGHAVETLARIALDLNATFVHYSTDYVFDGSVREGYGEDHAPNPASAYGHSKLLGEVALRRVAAEYPFWRWYLIRTSRLFGHPASSPKAKQSFVDAILTKAASNDRLEVVDAEVSSPTYTPDLAAATRELVLGPDRGAGNSSRMGASSGIYHRTNDGHCTWYQFATEALRHTGWRGMVVPVPASAYPRPASRPAYSVLRTTKLPPLRYWTEALSDYLASAASDDASGKKGSARPRARSEQATLAEGGGSWGNREVPPR